MLLKFSFVYTGSTDFSLLPGVCFV